MPLTTVPTTHEISPLFWRSLEERAGSEGFWAAVRDEFAEGASVWADARSRRQFLQSLGATLALAGLAGCVRQPDEAILPYVKSPEHTVPGKPRFFATAMPQPDGALGLLVKSLDGRPIKVEGNSLHSASLGATDVLAQASILDLYDPDRSQVVRRGSEISFYGAFLSELKSRLDDHRSRRGAGLRILTGQVTSPTLLHQLETLIDDLPELHWHVFEPLSDANVRAGSQQALGEVLLPWYRIDRADVIMSIDADLLGTGSSKTRLAREYADRRNALLQDRSANVPRLYVAEATPSQTGAVADHRLALRPSEMPALLAAIAQRVGLESEWISALASGAAFDAGWLNAAASDLKAAGARSLIAVGPSQPAELHALAFALNERLGGLHETIAMMPPIDRAGDRAGESAAELVAAMRQGAVDTLLVLETNPAFVGPAGINFAGALSSVPWSAHFGLYDDETAAACTWHVPTPHFLESWSDCRHADGTASIVQPLIAPLYNSQSLHQLLDLLLDRPARSAYEIVRDHWRKTHGEEDFERFWSQSLHDGIVPETAHAPQTPSLRSGWQTGEKPVETRDPRGWHLVFRYDAHLGDGRYANNGWLQELPRPFTTLTWGNAALVSPSDATQHRFKSGDVVEIAVDQQSIRIPVIVVPGQTPGVCALHLGHGRRRSGRYGKGVGIDVSLLQSADNPWARAQALLTPTGEHVDLAITQHHQLMEGRDLVRTTTVAELGQPTSHDHEHRAHERPTSLYPDWPQESPQWGMVINLSTCLGCQACVIACQAENNIPVVGAEQVRNGRRMHWLRVDTYYSGDPDEPDIVHQPVACMHCEHAPCEPVCPVAATTHSSDGLNEMTYIRCIGTRYCSNNCPYKVRRFNFLDYHQDLKALPVLQLQPNPDVTVRSVGVMEKCTYCVQRISRARIEAQLEHRELRDGDVVTACQAACPTQAIVFGDITDPDSRVAKAKSHPLNYGLLTELNTRPRTTYLAAVRNPHQGEPGA